MQQSAKTGVNNKRGRKFTLEQVGQRYAHSPKQAYFYRNITNTFLLISLSPKRCNICLKINHISDVKKIKDDIFPSGYCRELFLILLPSPAKWRRFFSTNTHIGGVSPPLRRVGYGSPGRAIAADFLSVCKKFSAISFRIEKSCTFAPQF